MLGAKDILVKITGDNKNFKGAMTGASGSMKGFATTTAVSSTAAATSTKAMALSMATSMAIATAGITLVIGGVVALAGALKAAVQGASDDADVTAQTTALLGQQGIAWDSVSGKVIDHIEALQNLTGFGDTELQESFNTFLASTMSVDDALLAMDAATAIAASGEMSLTAATKAVNKEYTTGTSKLKDFGIESDNFGSILDQVNSKFGDGSQRADTFAGKMGILTEAIMDQLKPLGAQLLPIIMDVLDVFIWGAQNVLPPLIRGFGLLMIPIKGVIMNLKQIYEVAKAAWAALTGDWEAAEKHWKNIGDLQREFVDDSIRTIKNIERETDAQDGLTTAVKNTTAAHHDTADAIDAETSALERQATVYRQSEGMRAAKAGINLGSLGTAGTSRKSGDWTIIPSKEQAVSLASKVAHNWMGSGNSGV